MRTPPAPRTILALPLLLAIALSLAPAGISPARADGTLAVDPSFLAPLPLIEVPIPDDAAVKRLAPLGLDIIEHHEGRWARILAWPGATDQLAAAGFRWRMITPDFGRMQAEAAGLTPGAVAPRNRLKTSALPAPGSGTMGGYYVLSEVYAWLDTLVAHDTHNIVSPVVTIGTSRQGRPIKAIRIADNSQPDHSRPTVLYTSLTHAREPGGMQAIVEYVNRLVDGYGLDPNLTYLVNSREMWFVPVVNPDGYFINQTTWQNSGSFGNWRRNARDNNSDGQVTSPADGVDLNRNYGYRWAYDNIGSSGSSSSDTYRGPSAFSEPETQAIKNFSITHAFKTAQNFHTYSELNLYPWGYISTANPDSAFYIRMSEDMQREAAYPYSTPGDLLYTTNGDANDWLYGEQLLKDKGYGLTIEIGGENDGFWPAQARILPLARLQHRANWVLAYSAGTYVNAEAAALVSPDGWWHPGSWADVSVTLRNSGLAASNGAVTVSATTPTAGVTILDATSSFPAMAAGAAATPSGGDYLRLLASPAVTPGTRVPLYLTITDGGGYTLLDTVDVTCGTPTVLLSDACRSTTGWTVSSTWGTQIVSGDTVFTESPSGKYAANMNASLTRTAALDLSGGTYPVLRFKTMYDTENGFDCARVEVSTNGGTTWTALTGRLTRPGHGNTGGYAGGTETLNGPCYDATQKLWGEELMDLSPYAGLTNVRLRFRFTSDSGLQRDGWKINDIQVLIYGPDVSAVPVADRPADPPAPRIAAVTPNPFGAMARVTLDFPAVTRYSATVFDVQGRHVRALGEGMAQAGPRDFLWNGRDDDERPVGAGAYYLRVEYPGGAVSRTIVKTR